MIFFFFLSFTVNFVLLNVESAVVKQLSNSWLTNWYLLKEQKRLRLLNLQTPEQVIYFSVWIYIAGQLPALFA